MLRGLTLGCFMCGQVRHFEARVGRVFDAEGIAETFKTEHAACVETAEGRALQELSRRMRRPQRGAADDC